MEAIAIKSQMTKKIRDFGLIDSILVSKQKEAKCKIIIVDEHFKTLKDI